MEKLMNNSYLPMMYNIVGKNILIVGGGAIAFEKLRRICDLECSIRIIAIDISREMQEFADAKSIQYAAREFNIKDLSGVDIVIAAVNDHELQMSIYKAAQTLKILCNAVDMAEYCNFIFPSVIKNGDLIVAISTSGASPALAKHLKIFFAKLIPSGMSEFLDLMRAKRTELPKSKERMKLLDEMAKEFVEKNMEKR